MEGLLIGVLLLLAAAVGAAVIALAMLLWLPHNFDQEDQDK